MEILGRWGEKHPQDTYHRVWPIQTPIMTDYLMPTQLFCILWNFSVSFTLVSLELVIGNQFTRKLSYFVITQRRYNMLKDISVWIYDPGMLIKKNKKYHLNKFPNHSHHVEEAFYSFITVIGDQGTSTLICFWGQEDWGGMSFCSNKIEAFQFNQPHIIWDVPLARDGLLR